MKNMYLIGTREIEDSLKHSMKLEYYLIEDFGKQDKEVPVYGICIKKLFVENGKELEEQETTEGLSYSKEIVMQMIDKLISNSVTPVSMVEIVDNLISESA